MDIDNLLRSFFRLLTRSERRTASVLLGLMIVGMLLEMLGIGIIIPAFGLVLEGSLTARSSGAAEFLARFGMVTPAGLIIAGLTLLLVVTAAKTFFLAYLAWYQGTFVFQLQADFSERLFAGYLRKPYPFHLRRNSAELIRNAMTVVAEVTNALQQSLILLTEVMVLSGVAVLLFLIEPVGAAVVTSALAFAAWIFQRVTRKRSIRTGAALQLHNGLRIQHLQQGLGAVKDIQLLGREKAFLAQYQKHTRGTAAAARVQLFLNALPRLWLELLAVVGLVLLVVVMLVRGRPVDAVFTSLAVFAAAALRFLPSVNRVLFAIQGMRFGRTAVETLTSELQLVEGASPAKGLQRLNFTRLLELDQVSFHYVEGEADVLRNVTLRILPGSSVGIIGESGAGKTTLVDVILGLLPPSRGSVRVDGVDVATNLRGWQDQIGYVPQTIFLTDDSLRRNVALGIADHEIDETAVLRAIAAAQLDRFVAALPNGLETAVGERGVRLSGGERQRIGIARALYHEPTVLIFDEATSSLDLATEAAVVETIKALHGTRTIVIVAHRLTTVADCDFIFRLQRGQLAAEGTPAVVLGSMFSAS